VGAALERLLCATVEAAAAADRAALTDESDRLRAADFTLHANLSTLGEALAQSTEAAEDGLRQLETHSTHQLQHGLDALGANLEQLLEAGVALEAVERQNACAALAAAAAQQQDSLESQVHAGRAAADAAADELRRALEAKDCVDRLLASLEEAERAEEMVPTYLHALYIYIYIYVYIYVYIYKYIYIYIYIYICLPIYMHHSLHLTHLHTYLPTHPPTHLHTSLPTSFPPIHLPTYPPTDLLTHQPTYLSR